MMSYVISHFFKDVIIVIYDIIYDITYDIIVFRYDIIRLAFLALYENNEMVEKV